MSRRLILLLLALTFLAVDAGAASKYSVVSPDSRIEIVIDIGDRITYSVLLRGKALLQDSTLSLKIDQTALGLGSTVASAKQRSVDQQIQPIVRQKFAAIPERYNELRLEMAGGY